MHNPACFVCETPLKLFGPCAGYTYYRCTNCRTIQLWPMPDAAALRHAYEKDYLAAKHIEEFADRDAYMRYTGPYRDCMIAALRAHGVEGPIVDCGAGWGALVERMCAEGFSARGVELSHDQVADARRRALPVLQGDLSALPDREGTLAAITLFAVFEHLGDHAALLRDARRMLRPDGLFITAHPTSACFNLAATVLRLGNGRRELPSLVGAFAPPWHTALLSIEATERIIVDHGFELLDVRPVRQGRLGGMVGLVQIILELVNKAGWAVMGRRWPLVTTHIFVFRKIGQCDGAAKDQA